MLFDVKRDVPVIPRLTIEYISCYTIEYYFQYRLTASRDRRCRYDDGSSRVKRIKNVIKLIDPAYKLVFDTEHIAKSSLGLHLAYDTGRCDFIQDLDHSERKCGRELLKTESS